MALTFKLYVLEKNPTWMLHIFQEMAPRLEQKSAPINWMWFCLSHMPWASCHIHSSLWCSLMAHRFPNCKLALCGSYWVLRARGISTLSHSCFPVVITEGEQLSGFPNCKVALCGSYWELCAHGINNQSLTDYSWVFIWVTFPRNENLGETQYKFRFVFRRNIEDEMDETKNTSY